MCQCYQIGGPFIAEDPNCPVHGIEARSEERQRDGKKAALRYELSRATTVADLRRICEEMIELIN